jgi:putative membrane protein
MRSGKQGRHTAHSGQCIGQYSGQCIGKYSGQCNGLHISRAWCCHSAFDDATDGSLTSYIFLLISGVIIAVGVVLPGISWSFMLLVLGMYEITLNAINTFNIPFLIPLGIGMVLGIFGTAKAIERFLQKYPRKTYMLIIGFVAGSLVEVYPGIPQGWQLPVSAAAFIAGFAAIFILGKKGFAE